MDTKQIIVFQNFDSIIDANIVKSKLDAYGIPCFLTEENLASLYPGASFLIKVRLHILNTDKDEVEIILSESNLVVTDDASCPRCQSTRLVRDFPSHMNDKLVSALRTTIFGIFFPEEKIYHCTDCHFEFD